MRIDHLTKASVLILTGYLGPGTALLTAEDSRLIEFSTDIRPIFAQHCIACHGGVKQAGGLSFVYRDNVLTGGDSGTPAVVPGDPQTSYLLDRVSDPDPDLRMPPAEHGPSLSRAEIDKLEAWIAQGAKWEQPWVFAPLREPTVPDVWQDEWCLGSLDRFALATLESTGLKPSLPAERMEWLRRVTFDLTGLPPSLSDVERFVGDPRRDAFERVVDRLLASPHFGEHWATMWLDLARYADTTGYEKDPHREIWPYRDWVIRAFNQDMPFDEFTVRQLAGDLLDNPSLDDRLATAFHRNTQTNTEGGTDDEEFRIAAVIDRVNTTWQVWQGTTFGCAQCHSHPYDPITHEEYYRFLAFLNNTRDADVDEDLPLLSVPLKRRENQQKNDFLHRHSRLHHKFHARVKPLAEDMEQWHNLPLDVADSTGDTQLVIRNQGDGGSQTNTEVLVEGAATIRSKFTLESPIPADVDQVTALRIDALLRDASSATRMPELGFVLSHLQASILSSDGKPPIELKFKFAFTDEAEPLLDPNASLDEDDTGWGSDSRQWQPQYAVFLLEKATPVAPGSRIRIELSQNRGTSGETALVLGRSRYGVSASDDWVHLQETKEFRNIQSELAELKERDQEIPCISVPVLEELPASKSRTTFVFNRGLWLDKAQLVEPGTPAALPSLPKNAPRNRLTMAKWLVSHDNPLTSRVMVNRVWAQLFGVGLVETAEDFGSSGTLPSHPELLDHLALRFQGELGWSLKRLLREIVLSATYRQSARATPPKLAADPYNRLLSRGPRQRLTAEMIRDQALCISELFSPKMHGPPVMPSQPEGIWRSVYSDAKWTNATGPDRYRRAIYTYWKRTSGYPGMILFDMPSREVCTARRIPTNTPLQALVTLNDEAYIEFAKGLADRMTREVDGTVDEKIAWAYLAATGREPSSIALAELTNMHQRVLQQYSSNPESAQPLGATPNHAALVVVASTILNLDEVLTK